MRFFSLRLFFYTGKFVAKRPIYSVSLASSAVVQKPPTTETSPYFDEDKYNITITTEAGMQLVQKWYDQAVSGLLSAVAMGRSATDIHDTASD